MLDPASLSSFHSDIGIPIKLHEQSGLSTFSSIELRGPLEMSRDVRPPVQMTLETKDVSTDCTDYDIPYLVK